MICGLHADALQFIGDPLRRRLAGLAARTTALERIA